MQSEDRPAISRRSLFEKTLAATGGVSLAGLAGSAADHHGGAKLKGNIEVAPENGASELLSFELFWGGATIAKQKT